jgi:hypothetical protein
MIFHFPESGKHDTLAKMLRPADLYLCLYLASSSEETPGYEVLAHQLAMGLASTHRSTERLKASGLILPNRAIHRAALLGLLTHGIRYVYYVTPGSLTRGVATADAAEPLASLLSPAEAPPVWPSPTGTTRGYAIEPLHKSAPVVAERNPNFYEVLALVDALRIGQARTRTLAEDELRKRLIR